MPDNSSSSPSSRAEAREFRTTHWSVVLAAGDSASPQADMALEKLCRTYWYPLYAYIRRRGRSQHDAEDLVQGFFACLLQRHAFRSVVPGPAKFRSFLLAALDNFLADEHDRQHAQKRGGGRQVISFDAEGAEERYGLESPDAEAPERLFDRRWAISLLDTVIARLEKEFIVAGKAALFEHLRAFIVAGGEGRPYAQVALELGMTEEAVKKSVQRLRRRYGQVIREEIAHTVATASEVEEELRYLVSVLGS